MDISVITVTWNAEDEIGRQIASVALGCKESVCEQIIVDNGSDDSTIDIVENMKIAGTGRDLSVHDSSVRDFHIDIIKNKENKGFGAANNQALPGATGEFLLFLNPDMRIEPESLDLLVDYMRQHRDVGIVGCRLVDEHGKINKDATPRRFPRISDMIATMLKLHHVFPALLHRYLMDDFDPNKEQVVDSVRGSFLFIRRSIVDRLGWAFDPRYFFWFEDVDICRETWRLGYKVMYVPTVSAVDYVGQSFKKRETLWKQKQFTKSMLTYFQKWEPWYAWMWIAVFRPVAICFTWVYGLFKKI